MVPVSQRDGCSNLMWMPMLSECRCKVDVQGAPHRQADPRWMPRVLHIGRQMQGARHRQVVPCVMVDYTYEIEERLCGCLMLGGDTIDEKFGVRE